MQTRAGSARDTLLIVAVPALLCAVTVLQWYLVESRSLTRWKGGGFGMFTTVDSPSARFLRVYLSSESCEVPVLIPSQLAKLSHQVRAMPSRPRLEALARALRDGTWVHLTMVSASRHYQDLLRAAGDEYRDSADDIRFRQDRPTSIDFEQMQLVRMLGPDERLSDDKPVRVTGVRVEVWRYLFDREALVLRGGKITEYSTAADGR